MTKRWVIADTHFHHESIILYESRPFANASEMNQQMIIRWNQVVSKQDEVFHLGDFGVGEQAAMSNIIKQLNGDIRLIIGNHDSAHSDNWWLEAGIKTVYRYPIILDGFFILSHEFVYLNDHMPYVNLHGHTHSKSMNSPQYVNCSAELFNYTPQNLDDIFNRYKSVNG